MTDDPARAHRQQLADRIERATRLPMTLLAFVFLFTVALPELVDLSPTVLEALEALDWFIWAVFAFELAVMTYLAPDRLRYLLTHWIDVLTVLLPFLRPLRLLRIVIITARLWSEVKVLIHQRTFSTVAMTSLVAVAASATMMYAVERGEGGPIKTYPDAIWWAASTVTTVGYGDVFPVTTIGRGIAFFLMLIGISMFGLLTARVAAFFVEADEQDAVGTKLDEILARLERLERQMAQQQPPPAEPGTEVSPAARAAERPTAWDVTTVGRDDREWSR
jgi:voltage-gated potassium channel